MDDRPDQTPRLISKSLWYHLDTLEIPDKPLRIARAFMELQLAFDEARRGMGQ